MMDSIKHEIEALHEFFVAWFTGRASASRFDAEFLARFDPDFRLIQPAGHLLKLNDIADAIHSRYASNPDFRIAIRNVEIVRMLPGYVLATYEEWQRNALASIPADNARLASVLLSADVPHRWVHVHETWLPEAIARAGPYDF
ncbi:MAG: hypothetical protein ACREV4_05805 [Gammaproteobacteria bacterium]